MKENEQNQENENVEVLETKELLEIEEILEDLEDAQQEEWQEDEEFVEVDNSYQRKPLRKLITLVAVTAIMLVSSTYAWFSAQKNITIGNLEGTVNVAEGLEVSLDAKNWSHEVDFSKFSDQNDLKQLYGSTEHNIIPIEMLPVSTTGTEGIDQTDITMYRGINTDEIKLGTVEATSNSVTNVADNKYPGYYAIDVFLRNSSRIRELDPDDPDDEYTEEDLYEVLQLNADSMVNVKATGGLDSTGLQNTVRVALALYNSTPNGDTARIDMTANQSQILAATTGSTATIRDVAIWEPNSSSHVDYIVTNNNRIKWTAGDKVAYIADQTNGKFTATEKVPTYALKGAATAITGDTKITDIYDWSGTNSSYLEKQITLQTTKSENSYYIAEGVQNLISVNSTETAIYPNSPTGSVTTFKIPKNQICRLRMYIWLEGQDVDCTNFASHGGGIEVDLGLIKSAEVGSGVISGGASGNVTSSGTYLPTGFREVAAATATTGLTIADGDGNEYVWVEVPKTTTVYRTAGLNITDFSSDEYTLIYNDLNTYTSNIATANDTHSGDDTSTGLTSEQYTILKQKMLKSVYENGGFYIGKYEAGIENSYREYTLDDTGFYTEHPVTETLVVQADAYPYNWIRCSQAQTKASGMASGEYTSSLMFGVQWNLVLKYLETKGVSESALDTDSTSWGNYANRTYSLPSTSSAKYNAVDMDTGAFLGWTAASTTPYTHNEGDIALLSTGASDSFSKMGIYDLAGNMAEWTLEYTSDTDYPCVLRGGYCFDDGINIPASDLNGIEATFSGPDLAFRPSIF